MRRNTDLREPQTIGIILIVMLIVLCVLTGCSSLPDVCQVGVPTNKACLSAQGNRGSFGFGPVNIITARF
jgi:hypothetical protein